MKRTINFESNKNTCSDNISKTFKMMGYKILSVAKKNENGPDMHVIKSDTVFRVELKKARKVRNSMSVHPVEQTRIHDDLITIIFPSGYVLIEPMKDHLKNCSASGYRSFFGVY